MCQILSSDNLGHLMFLYAVVLLIRLSSPSNSLLCLQIYLVSTLEVVSGEGSCMARIEACVSKKKGEHSCLFGAVLLRAYAAVLCFRISLSVCTAQMLVVHSPSCITIVAFGASRVSEGVVGGRWSGSLGLCGAGDGSAGAMCGLGPVEGKPSSLTYRHANILRPY